MIVKYEELKSRIMQILLAKDTDEDLAELASTILTDSTCDGIASHGINRLSRLIDYINDGHIKVNERAEVVSQFGAIEVLDGKQGLGMTNAWYCMDRAISLAKEHGIGCIALKNNNHWMRGATYGLQAASEGVIGICFTNTLPNMPAWGAKSQSIGNNPLVIAVPNNDKPVVLDMAMSQFSYGKMSSLALNGEKLPMDGGYNAQGVLTNDPQDILDTRRLLPMGYWKGSGLSIVLDLLATILSGGLSTKEVGNYPVETGVSQVFIAIDPTKNCNAELIEDKIKATIEFIKDSEPLVEGSEIYYPGEQSMMRRSENMKNGIPINDKVWARVLEL